MLEKKTSNQIFWRSKDGASAPPSARFSIWPFQGQKHCLKDFSIVTTLPQVTAPIRVVKRSHNPDKQTWMQLVRRSIDQIQTGALKKVVLARETTLQLEDAPEPLQITALLNKKSEGAALFCVQFEPNKAFFGATPERLFQSQDQNIVVEAVAGTRRQGQTPEECLRLEQELLDSAKDQHEFQFVQEYFRAHFPSIQFSPVAIHRTANVQHLFSRGTSLLSNDPTPQTLIEQLHPTPALCGTPKQAAFQWIHTHEPFSRGYYGGVLGWETPTQSEWMVTIRSCYLEGATAKLYTGTGIVAGSDPEKEWEELEAKLSLYEGVFQ